MRFDLNTPCFKGLRTAFKVFASQSASEKRVGVNTIRI
jgi:hypothetical protein